MNYLKKKYNEKMDKLDYILNRVPAWLIVAVIAGCLVLNWWNENFNK